MFIISELVSLNSAKANFGSTAIMIMTIEFPITVIKYVINKNT